MTLQEYLSQDPVIKRLQGSVLLEPTDFQYWTTFHNKNWEFSIHIYALQLLHIALMMKEYYGLWMIKAILNHALSFI